MVGSDPARAWQVWPSDPVDGPCRDIDDPDVIYLGSLAPRDFLTERVCGRTLASTKGAVHLFWTCVTCAPSTSPGRPVILHERVESPENVLPILEVYAELGLTRREAAELPLQIGELRQVIEA